MMWPKESIPDEGTLYMRAHRVFLTSHRELRPGVFRDHGGGMSTDWCKYSTPAQTRARARVPEDNGVIRLHVKGVRHIEPLLVEHDPRPDNRAHTEVIGEKTPEVRLNLLRIARWEISCAPSGSDSW